MKKIFLAIGAIALLSASIMDRQPSQDEIIELIKNDLTVVVDKDYLFISFDDYSSKETHYIHLNEYCVDRDDIEYFYCGE